MVLMKTEFQPSLYQAKTLIVNSLYRTQSRPVFLPTFASSLLFLTSLMATASILGPPKITKQPSQRPAPLPNAFPPRPRGGNQRHMRVEASNHPYYRAASPKLLTVYRVGHPHPVDRKIPWLNLKRHTLCLLRLVKLEFVCTRQSQTSKVFSGYEGYCLQVQQDNCLSY